MARAGRARRAALVEQDDLGADEAAELQGEHRQQHRLAGAGRTDDQRVADVADVQVEPERRRAARLRQHQRRGIEMWLISGPAHTADTGIRWVRFKVWTMGWRTLA